MITKQEMYDLIEKAGHLDFCIICAPHVREHILTHSPELRGRFGTVAAMPADHIQVWSAEQAQQWTEEDHPIMLNGLRVN